MRNRKIIQLTIVILVSWAIICNFSNFGIAQNTVNISGIIKEDATWTKVNSPYTFTGPVSVYQGVTLTIEAGVQVFFEDYYLQVNGTLIAKGTDNEPVSFLTPEGHFSEIVFMPSSPSWDAKTGKGSIIEKANIPSNDFIIIINGTSPKIDSSDCNSIVINDASPQITNNRISSDASVKINGGSPLISNNRLYDSPIEVNSGSPIISNNILMGDGRWRDEEFLGYGGTCIVAWGGTPQILNNNITNCGAGIIIGNGVIEKNTFINCTEKAIIINGPASPTIKYNNIGFSSKSIVLSEGASQDVDASNNWWGTIDEAAISQSIVDSKNDFNLGKVTYTPILTEQNMQAVPDIDNSLQTTPEFSAQILVALLVVIGIIVGAVLIFTRKKDNHFVK